MGLLDWMGDIFGTSAANAGTLPPQGMPGMDVVPPNSPSAPITTPPAQPATGYAMPPGGMEPGSNLPPLPTGNVPPAPQPMDIGAMPTEVSAQSSPQQMPGMMPPQGGGGGLMDSLSNMFGGAGAPKQGSGGDATILGRALGLSKAQAGALGAGLKSVGENYTKPGLAAFSGSAGAAMEGGAKAEDKLFEQRHKALSDMISAQAKGNTAEYMRAQAAYLRAKTELENKKFADPDAAKGISPEERFVKIESRLAADQQIRAARDALRSAVTPQEKKDAQAKFDDIYDKKKKEFTARMTRGSQYMPFKPTTAEDIKGLQVGQFYINPTDGKLYRFKGSKTTPDPAKDAVNGPDEKDE